MSSLNRGQLWASVLKWSRQNTFLQYLQLKGKKSIYLQYFSVQCWPKFENSILLIFSIIFYISLDYSLYFPRFRAICAWRLPKSKSVCDCIIAHRLSIIPELDLSVSFASRSDSACVCLWCVLRALCVYTWLKPTTF